MQTVDDLIDEIIRKEGGFTSDPTDKAHQKRRSNGDKWDSYCTNMGVTQETLSEWLERQATVEEVANLHRETVEEIFRVKYLVYPRIDTLPQEIQPVMLDSSVNHGPSRPCKWVQEITNLAGFGPISMDGVIGPQSRRAISSAVAAMGPFFVNAFVERRIKFFQEIVNKDPTQSKYLNGWTKRANSFRIEV